MRVVALVSHSPGVHLALSYHFQDAGKLLRAWGACHWHLRLRKKVDTVFAMSSVTALQDGVARGQLGSAIWLALQEEGDRGIIHALQACCEGWASIGVESSCCCRGRGKGRAGHSSQQQWQQSMRQ